MPYSIIKSFAKFQNTSRSLCIGHAGRNFTSIYFCCQHTSFGPAYLSKFVIIQQMTQSGVPEHIYRIATISAFDAAELLFAYACCMRQGDLYSGIPD